MAVHTQEENVLLGGHFLRPYRSPRGGIVPSSTGTLCPNWSYVAGDSPPQPANQFVLKVL